MYSEYIVLLKTDFVGGVVKSFIISTTFLLIVTFTVLFINNTVNKIAKTKHIIISNYEVKIENRQKNNKCKANL